MEIYRPIYVMSIICFRFALCNPAKLKNKTLLAEGRVFGDSENALPTDYASASYGDPWASPVPDSAHRYDEYKDVRGSGSSAVSSLPANKYKLKVSCGIDEMKVYMEFEKPFHGVVYSKGYFNKKECVYLTANKYRTAFNFSIGYDKCGSFTRDAQVPDSTFSVKSQSETATTPAPPTRAALLNNRKIDNLNAHDPAEETYEQWLERKYASVSTTTLAPETTQQLPISAFVTSPPMLSQGAVPVGMQQYPGMQNTQPVYNAPVNSGFPQTAPYGNTGYAAPFVNQMVNQQPGFGTSFGPGYGTGVAVPQSLLPTSLNSYANVPLQQRGYPMQTLPQQYQAGQYPNQVGYTNQAYPYNNLGYGRMGRSMDADAPATDMQWVENTIIIQQDRDVQDALDEAKSLQCEWKKSYSAEKKVDNGFRVDAADVVRASFPGDSVGAYMQIRRGLGPLAPEAKGVVKIGSPLTLVIALTESENRFDLFVHTCTAKGSGRAPPIPLVDVNGCIVRDRYMGPFIPFYNGNSTFGANRVSFSYFQAFKFPDSTDVNIDCAVTICRNSCPRQCFGKYTADAETLVKEWNRTESARSLTPDPVVRPKNGSAARDQRMIMDLLEKKMAAANGPQRFDVNVQAQSPPVSGPTKFLQLRQLDEDTTVAINTTSAPQNSTAPSVKRKVKREADESSDVGLKKKFTVIYPKDIEGMDDSHLLPLLAMHARTTAKSIASTTTRYTGSSGFPTTAQTTTPSSSMNVTTATPSLMTTLFSTVAGERITPTPAFYVLRDEMQHVCVPMMGMIVGGGGCILILFLAIISSFCVCCSMRRKEKKLKQSYPMYSEPRSVAIKAFPHNNSRTLL